MSITIEVVFRYNKIFDVVEMFYYDEHKDLVCFSLEEGHTIASYEYYLSCNPISLGALSPLRKKYEAIINYYENDGTTHLRIMNRLKYKKCSY